MNRSNSSNALIGKIERLYLKISLKILHRRMASYHKTSVSIEHAQEIKSPLQECIDIIVGYALDNTEVVYPVGTLTAAHLSRSRSASVTGNDEEQISHQDISELSRYFKARSQGVDLHPSIQEKLENSIWDHVHATIRYARQGDKANSRMHMNIANCACKELAHYLEKNDYRAFTGEVSAHLATLKTDFLNGD